MRITRTQNIVVWMVVLQHTPHTLDKFGRIAPVSACLQVAQIQLVLAIRHNLGDGPRDLPCHECFASSWAFMVEVNAVAAKQTVRLAIIYCHPIGVHFRGTVWTTRMEARVLVLWRRSAAEHL